MSDPISIGLGLLMAVAKNAATSEIAKAAFSGIVGNRADHFLTNGFRKVKEIISLKEKEFPENHDLLRTLRKSMLTATDMLYVSMKVDGEKKQFRKKLKSWIDEQVKILPNLSEWADWSNPATEKFELFFANEKVYIDKKEELILEMTNSWGLYLSAQLNVELPKEFKHKLNNGWKERDRIITWHEATMVLMIELLRSSKDEMGQRASKAFEHNFLSDIKLQLSDIQELMLSQFPNSNLIFELSNTVSSQQKTIESQQDTIASLKETVGSLTGLLSQTEKIRANLSEEIRANHDSNEKLKHEYGILTGETARIRSDLIAIYNLYPATFRNQLEEVANVKTLDQLSREADLQMEFRKKMEEEEVKRNVLLKIQLGRQLETTFDFTNALINYKKAIHLCPELPESSFYLGQLLYTIGQFQEANKVFNNIIKATENDNLDYQFQSQFWDILGCIEMELLQYGSSIESFKIADKLLEKYREEILDLKIDEGSLKQGSVTQSFNTKPNQTIEYYSSKVRLLNNAGAAYQKAGQLKWAIDFLNDSLNWSTTLYGNDSYAVSTCLNNLGDIFKIQGDAIKAKEHFDKALNIFKEKGIIKPVALPVLYDNLSSVNLQLGNIEEALKFAQEGLTVRTSLFGERTFHTAKSYLIVGQVFKAMGEPNKALENFLQASLIYEGEPINGKVILSSERKNGIVDTYLTIAYHLMDCKKWDEAYSRFEIPKNIFTIDFGENSTQVARIHADRANCLFKTNRNDKNKINEAKKLWQMAITIFQVDKRFENEIIALTDNINYANEILTDGNL